LSTIFTPVYDVAESDDGKKGVIMSNPEAIGQAVFVCDAYRGITIMTVISRANNHKGAIELPARWIGKKVNIIPFKTFSITI
jgi:hypothetical protein